MANGASEIFPNWLTSFNKRGAKTKKGELLPNDRDTKTEISTREELDYIVYLRMHGSYLDMDIFEDMADRYTEAKVSWHRQGRTEITKGLFAGKGEDGAINAGLRMFGTEGEE